MAQTTDQPRVETAPATDLVAAVQRVLAASPEPLTLSKIRAHLPAPYRSASPEELADVLQRQVAANVLYQFPRYRSQNERYWDRPMPVHIATLLRQTLQEGPLAWSEIRRRLPPYAAERAEAVLQEEVAQGRLYRHPRAGKRGGERYGVLPADPKEYLRAELGGVFRRLEQQGFHEAQVRAAALELLHDEEWSPATSGTPQASSATPRTSTATNPAPEGGPSAGYQWSDEQTAGAPDRQP
jgi:hypothetical protein